MIQRIQSIYLLLVVALMAVTAFSPLLSLQGSGNVMQDMYSCGIYQAGELMKPTWGVLSMAGLSALVAFINIFLFKKRKLQIKLGTLTAFLLIMFYVAAGAYFYVYSNRMALEFSGAYYGIILPLIALILNFMAIGRIKKDEKLVRSLDRIR